MAVSAIKDLLASDAALTITLASLASSTAGVGRQSTIVDNTTNRYPRVVVYYKIKLGTSPTSARAVYFYLIRSDADGTTKHRDGAAGASDAAWTATPDLIPAWVAADKASGAATGDVLQGSFTIDTPGPEWGVGVVHDTGVNLDSTGSNHWLRYVGVTPEAQ
jgi:hypothetical protein